MNMIYEIGNITAKFPWKDRSKVLSATHPLMLVIIFAKYGKNTFRTVHTVERTWQNVPYFSSFIAKSWLNYLQGICQGQRSLCTTHPLVLVIICAQYRKNPSRTVGVTEWTRHARHMFSENLFSAVMKQAALHTFFWTFLSVVFFILGSWCP